MPDSPTQNIYNSRQKPTEAPKASKAQSFADGYRKDLHKAGNFTSHKVRNLANASQILSKQD